MLPGEEVILYQPGSYTVDNNGNIYIGDRSDNIIKVFDSNGKFIRSIGRKGEGPGEFQTIGRMAILPDKSLLVMDWRNRRTSLFDLSGNFLNSYQWRNSHFSLFFVTDSSYTIEENFYGEDQKLLVKTYSFNGDETVPFGEFTSAESKTLRTDDIIFSITLPYPPKSIFTGDSQNHWLYHCYNNTYLIEVYNSEGKLFRKIHRPYQAVLYTDKDKEEYMQSFSRRDNNPIFAKMAKDVDFPEVKTITERLVVDEQGNLWLQTNEEKKEDGKTYTAYDIFNKDGYYEAKIWMNISPGLFANGKLYSYIRDEKTDLRVLKRYKIIWKE
jgi:hypothetical protein